MKKKIRNISNFSLIASLTMAEAPDYFMKTYSPTYKYTFKWLIENVSNLPEDFQERSFIFSVSPQSEWYAEICVGDIANHSLYFYRKANSKVTVTFQLSVSDGNGGNLYDLSKTVTFDSGDESEEVLPDSDNYANYKDKMVNAENLLFTVLIEAKHPPISAVMNPLAKLNKNLQTAQPDLKETKSNSPNKTGGDFTLTVQNEVLCIRKEALSSTSPVFSKMILQETTGNVHIDDVNPATMKTFIKFLYSGVLEDYDFNTALELYFVANKFDVPKLKEFCSQILVSKTSGCLLKVISIAEKCNDQDLLLKLKYQLKEQLEPL